MGWMALSNILSQVWNLEVIEFSLKGLVYPKMKIKSLITHPHAVPTLTKISSSFYVVYLRNVQV